jgi:hypothetical protein
VYKLKSQGRPNVYLNNVNQNFNARSARTVEYNQAAHISVVFDELSMQRVNVSLPSSFERKSDLLFLIS